MVDGLGPFWCVSMNGEFSGSGEIILVLLIMKGNFVPDRVLCLLHK